MSQALPELDATEVWHEWSLVMTKGTDLLTRYLWKDASITEKAAAQDVFRFHLATRFEKLYVPEEGAFGYYPEGKHASLDGAGAATG